MRRRALNLLSVHFEHAPVDDNQVLGGRRSVFGWVAGTGLLASTVIVILGLSNSSMRNLVGLGAGFFVIFLFLFYSRRRYFS